MRFIGATSAVRCRRDMRSARATRCIARKVIVIETLVEDRYAIAVEAVRLPPGFGSRNALLPHDIKRMIVGMGDSAKNTPQGLDREGSRKIL